MNKLSLILLGALAGVTILFIAPRSNAPVGIPVSEPSFGASSVTETTISCGSAASNGTGTLALATTTGRLSAIFQNLSAVPVALCRRNGCTTTSTVILNASSSAGSFWEQTDAYIGPYSCVAINATNSISVSQAQ